MKALVFLVVGISFLTSGCAYVEFSRQYEVSGIQKQTNIPKIERTLEEFFSQKGLKISRAYTELYPEQRNVLIFDLPWAEQKERRDAHLTVTIKLDRNVTIKQEEWFVSPSSEENYPSDFINQLTNELEEFLENRLNEAVSITFEEKSYY